MGVRMAWVGVLQSRVRRGGWSASRSLAERRAAGELGEAEDHELGRLHRRDPDVHDELAGVDRLRGVVLAVALDEDVYAPPAPEQGAVAPGADEEGRDGALHALPEVHVVRLEDHPLRSQQDRLLDVVEEATHVEVAPGWVRRERPGAPDADSATGEGADAVDPDRVELVVLGAGQVQLERDGAPHDLVCGCLVDAPLAIAARPDTGHVAGWRHERGVAGDRVEDLDPGPVQGGVLRIVAGLVLAPLLDLLGSSPPPTARSPPPPRNRPSSGGSARRTHRRRTRTDRTARASCSADCAAPHRLIRHQMQAARIDLDARTF